MSVNSNKLLLSETPETPGTPGTLCALTFLRLPAREPSEKEKVRDSEERQTDSMLWVAKDQPAKVTAHASERTSPAGPG